jgi:hypothetical protein
MFSYDAVNSRSVSNIIFKVFCYDTLTDFIALESVSPHILTGECRMIASHTTIYDGNTHYFIFHGVYSLLIIQQGRISALVESRFLADKGAVLAALAHGSVEHNAHFVPAPFAGNLLHDVVLLSLDDRVFVQCVLKALRNSHCIYLGHETCARYKVNCKQKEGESFAPSTVFIDKKCVYLMHHRMRETPLFRRVGERIMKDHAITIA